MWWQAIPCPPLHDFSVCVGVLCFVFVLCDAMVDHHIPLSIYSYMIHQPNVHIGRTETVEGLDVALGHAAPADCACMRIQASPSSQCEHDTRAGKHHAHPRQTFTRATPHSYSTAARGISQFKTENKRKHIRCTYGRAGRD